MRPELVAEIRYFGRLPRGLDQDGALLRVEGGVITLGEMRAKGMTMMEVACRRCERQGRLRIERLIAEHGAGVLDLRAVIAADCPCGTPQPRSMIAVAYIFPSCRAGSKEACPWR